MLELSSLGAKVLQIRSVEFAGKFKVPLRVLSSQKPGEGTLITHHPKERMESYSVTGIAFSRKENSIHLTGVKDRPGLASYLMGLLSQKGINAEMVFQVSHEDALADFSFVIHQDEYPQALALLSKAAKKLEAETIKSYQNLAKLSLVGAGLKSHPAVAPMMFKCLGDLNINIHLMNSSEIKLSVLIDEAALEEGVRALHKVFKLDEQPLETTKANIASKKSVKSANS